MKKARRAGKVLCPAWTADHKPLRVTLRYGISNEEAGVDWQAGHHTGEDHACPTGSLAVATSWGTVVAAGPGSLTGDGAAYGNLVKIRTRSGLYDYMLCHLSAIKVHVGQAVEPGQVVGSTGATGNVTGPHLHYETRPAGGHYGSDIAPIHTKQSQKGRSGNDD